MKYLFIVLMWLICPLGSASEFEIKPTHIISNKFSKEINGKELYWVDKTGQLNASEVIKFSSEFKELNLLTTEEEVDFEKNVRFLGTGAVKIPVGSNVQRPSIAEIGMVRYNTEI